MTEHTIEAHFVVTAGCSSADISRDERIIHAMALAVSTPGTSIDCLHPIAIQEATRVYLMINAMREALEAEVGEPLKVEQVV